MVHIESRTRLIPSAPLRHGENGRRAPWSVDMDIDRGTERSYRRRCAALFTLFAVQIDCIDDMLCKFDENRNQCNIERQLNFIEYVTFRHVRTHAKSNSP